MLSIREEAPVEMERLGEGSEEAREGEQKGRDAPFCVRRQHNTT